MSPKPKWERPNTNMAAQLQSHMADGECYFNPADASIHNKTGNPQVLLSLRRVFAKGYFPIILTEMKPDELDVFQQFINFACDLARPIAEENVTTKKEPSSEHDARHRIFPRFDVSELGQSEYDSRVQGGPDGFERVPREPDPVSGERGDADEDLFESQPGMLGASDGQAKAE